MVPFIRSMPPADDLCHTCQQNSTSIMKSANLSEDEKTERLLLAQEHLNCAKRERHYYRNKVASSKSAVIKLPHDKSVTLSYSFDHAHKSIILVVLKTQVSFILKLHTSVGFLEYVMKETTHN